MALDPAVRRTVGVLAVGRTVPDLLADRTVPDLLAGRTVPDPPVVRTDLDLGADVVEEVAQHIPVAEVDRNLTATVERHTVTAADLVALVRKDSRTVDSHYSPLASCSSAGLALHTATDHWPEVLDMEAVLAAMVAMGPGHSPRAVRKKTAAHRRFAGVGPPDPEARLRLLVVDLRLVSWMRDPYLYSRIK